MRGILADSVAAPSAEAQVAGIESLLSSDLIGELAVVATFDPAITLPAQVQTVIGHVTDALAPLDGRAQLMLRERVRIDTMAELIRREGRRGLVARRRVAGTHDTTLDRILGRALADGAIDIDELDDDELVAALHVCRWLVAAFGRGGRTDEIPSGLVREPIEGRLALRAATRPIREITAGGCVGRDDELERLRGHLLGPDGHVSLHEHPALLVYGVGGVGKSTLVAQFVLEIADGTPPWAWAYLDLDRPSLSSYRSDDVLVDIIRQIGAQFPDIRRYLESLGRDYAVGKMGRGSESVYDDSWVDLAPRLASPLEDACGGRLVVVVDTYEELQRAELTLGESLLGESLFRMFASMSESISTFRLIVSGRAPAGAFLSTGGHEQRLHVAALEGDAAVGLLQHLHRVEVGRLGTAAVWSELDSALARAVVESVGGSPLSLKLAAQVLAAEGYEAVADAVERSRVLGRVREEFVRGFLYNRVLRHIAATGHDDELVRAVARATLVLRVVTPDLLRDVIGPAIGREVDGPSVFASLRAETALADDDGNGLQLRDELRSPALRALRYDAPELVEAVHRRAVAYYDQHPGAPNAAAELLYHSLACGMPVDPSTLDAGTARDVERSVGDLGSAGRDIVVSAVQRLHGIDAALDERTRERELESMALRLMETDPDAAAAALADDSAWSATTRLHGVAATIHERRGDLGRALESAMRDLAAAELAEEPVRLCASAIHCALLQERVTGGGDETLTRIDAAPVLGGHVALRLELHLNRLAMLERGGSTAQRWVLELDARALLQRIDASQLQGSDVLVRLLAATLGRDDPALVMAAVDRFGLGDTGYSTHVEQMADALAAWDADGPDPGTVARSIGLGPASSDATDIQRAWSQGIAGLGYEARELLGRAFSVRQPGTGVYEALRTIFLWWGIDPAPSANTDIAVADTASVPPGAAPAEAGDDAEPEHFLDGDIDFRDARSGRFVSLLNSAYPDVGDVESLASRAGLGTASINTRQASILSVRDVVRNAGATSQIVPLVESVLNDASIGSFADEIRGLIGAAWLDEHGIT